MGLIFGAALAVLAAVFCTISVTHDIAVRNGAGEYYINTNNFEKEFRWKVCK